MQLSRLVTISHDFVLGLFVDLYDFCEKLPDSLEQKQV